MSINKKQKFNEFVDYDGGIIGGGDRNPTSNSEIETGPTQKTWDDNSDYEKGMSTTTDRATRYRQNIPWFAAVYSYRSSSGRGLPLDTSVPPMDAGSDSNGTIETWDDEKLNERKKILTKKQIDEEIKEDLVKKSKKDRDVFEKDYNGKTEKIIDTIEDGDLTNNQLEKIYKAVLVKLNINDNKNV